MSSPNSLTATYTSPTSTFTSTTPLPGDFSSSLQAKTTYLFALRTATAALQDKINAELTQRMEEDKLRAATEGGKVKFDEAKEEENYGEEVVDEDE
jgi:protease II